MLRRIGEFAAPINLTGSDARQTASAEVAPVVDISAAARTPWYSHPARLTVICGIILVAVVIAVTAGLLSNLRDRDLAEKERALESLALVLAEQIDRSFQSIELIQTSVIERMKSLGIASAEDFERQMSGYETHRRLNDRVSALPYIDAMVVTNADGKLINFSRSWPIQSVKIPDQDPHEAFVADPQLTSLVGKPIRSPVTGSWLVPIARKFTGPNGEFLGVVTGVMGLEYFEQLFQAISSTPNGTIVLFRRDGTLLVRFPRQEAAIGQSFPQSGFLKTLATSDHGTSREIGVIDGQERLVSVRSLAHYPVALVATTTVADALANWTRGAIAMVVVALTIGLVIGGAVFFSISAVGRRLREQSLQRNIAFDSMSQGLAMFNSAGRLLVCNDRYRQMYDYPPDLAKSGCTILDLLKCRVARGTFSGDPEEYVRDLRAMIAKGETTRLLVETGGGRITKVVNQPMADGGWVATHEDVTEAKRIDEALLRANQELIEKQYAIDQAVIVAVTDVKGIIIYANDHFCRISGYAREELLGANHRILNSGIHSKMFFGDMYRRIASGQVWRGEVCNKAKNGSLYWVDTTIVPQLGADGKPIAYMAIRIDITARKQAVEKVSFMAGHDALTGLGNRAVLNEKLEEASARLRRHQETFTVLLLDLDGFKNVNDTLAGC
jgi:PAS domain S-box-containing protein